MRSALLRGSTSRYDRYTAAQSLCAKKAVVPDRLAEGVPGERHHRACRSSGTRLYAAPGFPALAEKLGLIDYWETVDWGGACRPGNDGMICDGAGYRFDAADNE